MSNLRADPRSVVSYITAGLGLTYQPMHYRHGYADVMGPTTSMLGVAIVGTCEEFLSREN